MFDVRNSVVDAVDALCMPCVCSIEMISGQNFSPIFKFLYGFQERKGKNGLDNSISAYVWFMWLTLYFQA